MGKNSKKFGYYLVGKLEESIEKTEKAVRDDIISFLDDLSKGIIHYSPTEDGATKAPYSNNGYVSNTAVYTTNASEPYREGAKGSTNSQGVVPNSISGLEAVKETIRTAKTLPNWIMISNNTHSERSTSKDHYYWYNVEVSGWGNTPPYRPFELALGRAAERHPMLKKCVDLEND